MEILARLRAMYFQLPLPVDVLNILATMFTIVGTLVAILGAIVAFLQLLQLIDDLRSRRHKRKLEDLMEDLIDALRSRLPIEP